MLFNPNPPKIGVDFTALGSGDPITDLTGWSGSATIVGAAPRDSAHNPHATVLTTEQTSNVTATSPGQTLSPALTTSDTVYFSAWINWSGSTSSNVRITLKDADNYSLGAFGLASKQFGMADANGNWLYSTETLSANKWYELAMVVDLDEANLALSRGYLFVRDVAAGSDFHLLSGFEDGVVMGYGSSLNATAFSKWDLQLRNLVQIDNLSVGTAVPEPGSLSLVMGVGLVFAGLKYARPLLRTKNTPL